MARKNPVVVVDYGLGNLFSIGRALQHLGAEAVISGDPKVVAAAGRVILPGVGAFGDGMKGLTENGLVGPLREFCRGGKPVLGICLGLQLMMEEGTEFGFHKGLGLIKGSTVPLSRPDSNRAKIPHVGWNLVRPPADGAPSRRPWRGTVMEGVSNASYFYFVHSFVVVPADPAERLGETAYAGKSFCSAVRSGNISGCQFHPEKSGQPGLKVLHNFLVT